MMMMVMMTMTMMMMMMMMMMMTILMMLLLMLMMMTMIMMIMMIYIHYFWNYDGDDHEDSDAVAVGDCDGWRWVRRTESMIKFRQHPSYEMQLAKNPSHCAHKVRISWGFNLKETWTWKTFHFHVFEGASQFSSAEWQLHLSHCRR